MIHQARIRWFSYETLSPVFAFLLWGAWTIHANAGDTLQGRLVSGAAQGLISFFVTILMVKVIGILFATFPPALRLALPSLIVIGGIGAIEVAVHKMIGTRNVFDTIKPNLVVGFVFCVITTFRLWNLERTERDAQGSL